MTFRISIVSDVVCPWCYVGKRRLERALDDLGLRQRAEITWLPFELNPDMPPGGMERAGYRAAKFGAARSAELDRAMSETGRGEGIRFAFDRMQRTPNSRRAHLLIAHANRTGLGDAVVERLFRAYFEEARDVGDDRVLLAVAAEAGLDPEAARTALEDPDLLAEVVASERRAAEIGVTGVPFFIVDERWAMSGAQPSEAWSAALRQRVAATPA
ncbi:MAG: DsbA family oxidoreductase [Enterovirga sp.]|jgi:predicted DsbA family dithiol-disulfide isomerase|nr:DsbA family oxidoreductase [Enterovirga sp.]